MLQMSWRRGAGLSLLRRLCLLLPLLCLATPLQAASPPAAPVADQPAKIRELLGLLGDPQVQDWIKAQQAAHEAKPPAAAPTAKPADVDVEALVVGKAREALGEIPKVLGGYPAVWTDLADLPTRLDAADAGGRGLWAYLSLLAATAAVALFAEAGVARLTLARRHAVAHSFAVNGGLWRVVALAFLDVLAFVALWLVVHLALGVIFANAGAQTQFAALVLKALVTWRLFMLLFRLFLRPDMAAARIAPVTDESARRIFRLFEFAVVIFILARESIGALVAPEAIAAVQLTNSVVVVAVFIFAVIRTRHDVGNWLRGLINEGSRAQGAKVALADHWHWIAVPILVVLAGARAYDALSQRFQMPFGAILTLNILLGLLFAETLLSFVVRPRSVPGVAAIGRREPGRLARFLVRAVRATMWVVAAAVLVRTWAVDVLNLVDERTWNEFSSAWTTAAITALVAYFAWEAVHFATEPRRHRPTPGATDEDSDKAQASASSSRLETLAPIFRVVLGVVIFLTAALVILASLGISITPFIAGASVFGLAISFGSQTLVHDIVSGIFYLADDAFRVGEYIDCGKAKGTVEGFTLRSIRLRHQNGPVHTIPFGQLGQITNFSRDYSTLKFNLRFDRNTDLDKLRKVTKKVGQAMLADPELKDDFLEPLKLQGIADIADNAMVMRFKLTVKPTRPSYMQREAVKRLIAAFKEAGLEFASATVAVQTVGGPAMDQAVAAAAASASATKTG
ncbi:MAG TPA: mechanosensitive ion channel domain-containing protein [Dongiaceae bacterium]|nr:mechanosensitive ion channel domain-containing protein [Dongiaceae bacterium]